MLAEQPSHTAEGLDCLDPDRDQVSKDSLKQTLDRSEPCPMCLLDYTGMACVVAQQTKLLKDALVTCTTQIATFVPSEAAQGTSA